MSEITINTVGTGDVLIDKKTVGKMNQMIHRDPHHECGGLIIGNISKDEISRKHTVHVIDLYYEERTGTSSNFEFTTDYIINAVKYAKKHYKEKAHIIGNVHSHGDYPAFFSATDREMMHQARDNSFYMVISPRYGTWEAIFKDDAFQFYDCDVQIADGDGCRHMFEKTVTEVKDRAVPDNVKDKAKSFRVDRSYTDTQRAELDKRFLHSVNEMGKKKVLIIGDGTIGSLIAQNFTNSGIGHITTVDPDTYEYWNQPRCCMTGESAWSRPKAFGLTDAIAEKACFPIQVTGVHADICQLGWTFFKKFDLVVSPVDSAAIRQYVDRGCKIYHIPHITCGTGIIAGDFTGNVIVFPKDAAVDLEYVWGTGYRQNLEERRSCADYAEETQAQVMGFSAQIAGITTDLALKILQGKMSDTTTVWKYVLNSAGNGYERDKAALRTYKYSRHPAKEDSELYRVFDPSKRIPVIKFNRSQPKRKLWKQLNNLLKEDVYSYSLNLEWSLNIPVAYHSTDACARIEVYPDAGVDPTLRKLPDSHVYLVEGDRKDYLVEIHFNG